MTALVQGCGGGDSSTPAASTVTALSCDDSLKTAFKPDANTTLQLGKSFKADGTVSLPLCVYPQKVCYSGTDSVTAAGSDACQ